MCLDFGNVVRAYVHAKARRGVCVDLSMEDLEEQKCGLLKKAMCGNRDAARTWEVKYMEMLVDAGFRQGSYTARVLPRSEERPSSRSRR